MAKSIHASVKWGKTKFDNICLDLQEPPSTFKAQLFALTGVPPERQKIMVKGGLLKDDDDWNKFGIKEGHTFMMMGTSDSLQPSATEGNKEASAHDKAASDDMETDSAQGTSAVGGLENLGNTCYMNATLQCLRVVPELRTSLLAFKGKYNDDPSNNIAAGLRDVYGLLETASGAVNPWAFVTLFKTAFPQFAQIGQGGVPMQQDAQECWSQLLRTVASQLPSTSPNGNGHTNLIEQYFTGKLRSTMTLSEAAEKPIVSTDTFHHLTCHITTEVNYLMQGLKHSLNEKITKHSAALDRDAVYDKKSEIDRLPSYLTIHLVRFAWKGTVSAKILRNVRFPLQLDVFELCTAELQEQLKPTRTLIKTTEDAEVEAQLKAKQSKLNSEASAHPVPAASMATRYMATSFPEDVGSNNSGYYELLAVLSHKGRSSDSGHYLGWVRRKDDEWLKFDDDHVSIVRNDDILKLSGGGDWHMAYMLLYGPRMVKDASASVDAQQPTASR